MVRLGGILGLLLLVGCGESSQKNEVPKSLILSPPITTSLYAENILANVQKNELSTVSLRSKVHVSDDSSIYLTSVESLNHSSDCDVMEIKKDSFVLESYATGACSYRYEVALQSEPTIRANAIAYIAVQPQSTSGGLSTQLPVISKTWQEGHAALVIDLKSALGTDYPKETTVDVSVTVLGNGTATVDRAKNTLTYTGGDIGISRILYSLTHNTTDVVYLGMIDISISETTNQGPTFTDFEYTKSSGDNILEGEEVEIDVSSYLTDIDGAQELQIVDLNAFNATVQSFNLLSKTNKKFTFKAQTTGVYQVAVSVTDHNGGYTVGLVTVKVTGGFFPIIVNKLIYLPPYTLGQINYLGLDYLTYETENGTTGPDDIPIPIYDFSMAKEVCAARGGHLPSKVEMNAFKTQEEKQLWVTSDQAKQQWPISKSYFTSEINDSNEVAMITFNNDGVSSAVYSDVNSSMAKGYLTCVIDEVTSLSITTQGPLVIGGTTVLDTVYSTASGNSYVYQKYLDWTSLSPELTFGHYNVTVDDTANVGMTLNIQATDFSGELTTSKNFSLIDIIPVSDDTSFRGVGYDTEYDASDILYVHDSVDAWNSTYDMGSALAFDVSLQNDTITKATIRIFLMNFAENYLGKTDDATLSVSRITNGSFKENELIRYSAVDSTATVVKKSQVNSWVELDVTDIVKTNKDKATIRFILLATNAIPTAKLRFASKENTEHDGPKLIIE